MKYPIAPDALDQFNAIARPWGWYIRKVDLAPPYADVFDDEDSSVSRYMLDVRLNVDDVAAIVEYEDWGNLVRNVRGRAEEGSEPHREALRFFETYAPKEWRLIHEVPLDP